MDLDVWVEGVSVAYGDNNQLKYFTYGYGACDKGTDTINFGKYENDNIDILTRYVIVLKREILLLKKSLYFTIDNLKQMLDLLYQAIDQYNDKLYKLIQEEV